MNGTSSQRTFPALTPILLAVLTLAVGVIGIRVSYLQLEANRLDHRRNELEHERKEPSIEVYVDRWEIVKHSEAVDGDAYVRDLEVLEDEHRRYSGRFILDERDALVGRMNNSSGDTIVPGEVSSSLERIREGIQELKSGRAEDVPALVEEVEALIASWRRESDVSQTMVEQLADLERRYPEYTGFYVLSLEALLAGGVADPAAVDLSRAVSLLEDVSAAIKDELAFDEPGFDALFADLESLMKTYVEGKEGQRLSVEAVVENQSQLATVVRREARVEVFGPDRSIQKMVSAGADLNLGPYSVGSMVFVSGYLDAGAVGLLGDEDGREMSCKLAVLDLREKPWLGEFRAEDVGDREQTLMVELRQGTRE